MSDRSIHRVWDNVECQQEQPEFVGIKRIQSSSSLVSLHVAIGKQEEKREQSVVIQVYSYEFGLFKHLRC